METAMEIALRQALVRKGDIKPDSKLNHVVGEWSADDHDHVDPPLSNPVSENAMAFASPPTTSAPASHHASGSASSVVSRPGEGPSQVPNVTRLIWQFIKDNPGMVRMDVVEAMVQRGVNRGSASSLIGQMVLQGRVKMIIPGRHLHVTGNEFISLKSGKERDELIAAKRTKKGTAVKGERGNPSFSAEHISRATQALIGARKKLAAARKNPEWRHMLSERLREARARRDGKPYIPRPYVAATQPAAPPAATTSTAPRPKTNSVDRVNNTRKVLLDVRAHKRTKNVAIDKAKATGGNPRARNAPAVHNVEPVTADLRSMTGEQIVQSLSVVQAREVLRRLQEIFG